MSDPDDESTRSLLREALEEKTDRPATRSDIEKVHAAIDAIRELLGKGNTRFAMLEHRVQFLERIVFSACALVGIAVISGVLALIIRSSP